MKKLFSFDVRLNDLESLNNAGFKKTATLLEFLKAFWFRGAGGSDPDYLDKVRVGTVGVFLDDEEHLHLDFVTRFSLRNYPEILKELEALKD